MAADNLLNQGMRIVITAALCIVSLAGNAVAQSYPSKLIRLVTPSSPGGGIDALARIVANASPALGQQIIVDNRPGANGIIGTDLAAKAPPDGYTLVLGFSGSIAVNINLYKKLPYDPIRDFAPITLIAQSPQLIVTHPSVPAGSIRDLIKLDKTRPGQLTYGTGGTGTAGHLTMEMFNLATGTKIQHIPYKGVGPALTDVLGGQISLMISSPISSQPLVQSKKLRALALTGRTRLAVLPDVPTVIESGLANFESTTWFGVLAPAGTPPAIITRLNREIVNLLRQPEIKEQISRTGATAVGNTPDEFSTYIQAEIIKWGKVIKEASIKLE
ncbi:MAG: tripartite tricarboxylate transporter substrate binding protein [Burkholderiales bacterium]|nr:tripartite tricarboxylate transporter substrate binding protein [Burkholderiales bacterium]